MAESDLESRGALPRLATAQMCLRVLTQLLSPAVSHCHYESRSMQSCELRRGELHLCSLLARLVEPWLRGRRKGRRLVLSAHACMLVEGCSLREQAALLSCSPQVPGAFQAGAGRFSRVSAGMLELDWSLELLEPLRAYGRRGSRYRLWRWSGHEAGCRQPDSASLQGPSGRKQWPKSRWLCPAPGKAVPSIEVSCSQCCSVQGCGKGSTEAELGM